VTEKSVILEPLGLVRPPKGAAQSMSSDSARDSARAPQIFPKL
jgi:hypothetical protein